MEIRVGLKYRFEYSGVEGEITRIDGEECSGEFLNSTGSFMDTIESFKNDIESGECKITHYPYKVGDWIKILVDQRGEDVGTVSKIVKVNKENCDYNAVKRADYGTWCASYESIRPAFESEIPKEVDALKIGKWYKGIAYGTDYIIKYNGSFSKTEHIFNENYYTSGAFINGITSTKEISLEEIQKYLPEGHIDKIKVMKEEKYMYKKGDKVRYKVAYGGHPAGTIDTVRVDYGGTGFVKCSLPYAGNKTDPCNLDYLQVELVDEYDFEECTSEMKDIDSEIAYMDSLMKGKKKAPTYGDATAREGLSLASTTSGDQIKSTIHTLKKRSKKVKYKSKAINLA